MIPLGLTTAAATNGPAQKKIYELATSALKISNKEMNGIIRIIISLVESSLLIKGFSETIENKAKEQKGGFLSMILGTLGASLLGNMLAAKGLIRAREGQNF